jgi:glycerophosphoryl diester phosphodiesterase
MNYWLSPIPKNLRTTSWVIGHRGARMHAPENTLGGFRTAQDQGAHGIEFDVQRCGSGEIVVIHDDLVNRTTNGKGAVRELSLREIQALDAGKGERIPTLDEVFDTFAKVKTEGVPFLFNVELKSFPEHRDETLPKAVTEVVRRHKMESRVLFSSFDPLYVRDLAVLANDIPRGYLYAPGYDAAASLSLDMSNILHAFRHPHFGMVTPEVVNMYRAKGQLVNVWTVNDRADIKRMADCGVCGIITDSPQTAFEVLSQSGGGGFG